MAYQAQSSRSWVVGATLGPDKRLRMLLQQLDGKVVPGTFANLAPQFKVAARRMKRVLVADLQDFEAASTEQYLAGIGRPDLESGGQACYQLTTRLGTVWVPAQLLAVALFATNAFTRSYLLHPLGLHMGMRTYLGGNRLLYRPTPLNPIRSDDDRKYAKRKFEWALNYPSAVAAWASIYASMAKGRLELALPAVQARMKLTGCQVQNNLFVTGLSVVSLSATEEPFEFARGLVAKKFILHNGLKRDFSTQTKSGPPASTFDAFVRATGGKPLTSAQWRAIEPLVEEGRYPTHGQHEGRRAVYPLRQLFDLLSVKFGTPVPWSKLDCTNAQMRAAKYIYLRLIERGYWEKVTAAVAAA
jgi:hypothetical protein